MRPIPLLLILTTAAPAQMDLPRVLAEGIKSALGIIVCSGGLLVPP